MSNTFKALIAKEEAEKFTTTITDLEHSDLPPGDTLVKVNYSSLNYKDGMALNGNIGRILRTLPMAPGIDFAGTIESSDNHKFRSGDEVILTGWGVGERHSGGYSQFARVKSEWLVHKPNTISLKRSMTVGTAGLTAMLSVIALQESNVDPSKGEILVTGASGGVGNISVLILSKLGYQVTAVTGRPELGSYLKKLGANKVIARDEILSMTRPLNSSQWAGAIDTTGGQILANVLTAMNYDGVVACCGNAAGNSLETTVLPFILRKISLVGIDSVICPIDQRITAWEKIGNLIDPSEFDAITETVSLTRLTQSAKDILEGKVRGRTVVDVNILD